MNNKNQDMVKLLAICVGAVMIVAFAVAALLSLLIGKGVMEFRQGVPVAVAVVSASTMVAANVCAKKVKRKKLFAALLVCACIIALLLVTKLVIAPQAAITLDWRMLLTVTASVCGAMLASQKKERKR